MRVEFEQFFKEIDGYILAVDKANAIAVKLGFSSHLMAKLWVTLVAETLEDIEGMS